MYVNYFHCRNVIIALTLGDKRPNLKPEKLEETKFTEFVRFFKLI